MHNSVATVPVETKQPIVTVVMLAMNRPQFLGRAIASVLEQTISDWELIVVQDGNHAEVTEILSAYARADARIYHVHRTVVGNVSDATNHALQKASGEFVAILDDDDAWCSPTKLAQQINFLKSHPACVACGGAVIVIDPTGREMLRYQKPITDQNIRHSALLANPIANSSALFRKAAAAQIGYYDIKLPVCQDWDFWLRLGQVGELANLPDYLLKYQFWPSNASVNKYWSNAGFALSVVWRHRKHYPRAGRGLLFASGYFLNAILPSRLRKSTFQYLSMARKRLFSKK